MDREKVIKAFRVRIISDSEEFDTVEIPVYEAVQILELLKEQEAVEPEREHSGGGTTWWNVCGNCKTAINPNDKFCHECGRAVKWTEQTAGTNKIPLKW